MMIMMTGLLIGALAITCWAIHSDANTARTIELIHRLRECR